MKIQVDTYEQIRYLYEHKGQSQRAIAKALGISRNTVKKYCEGAKVPWERQGKSGRRPYVITQDIMDFIRKCLEEDGTENIEKQSHTAHRIHKRLKEEKGYECGASTVRRIVAILKDKPQKVFIPLSFEPGEAVQVDWGVSTIYLAGHRKKIHLFCMRECYSADVFCIAFFRENEESFLEGLSSGFEFFNGSPRRVIFDNAKVGVKEGFGLHAMAQDRYKALSAHYAFKCEFTNIQSAHEKGLVEGLVGLSRRNMMVPIPRVDTLSELNVHLRRACCEYRNHRIQGRDQTVGEMALTAEAAMISLPKYKYDPAKMMIKKVDKFATVSFDGNRYSVPVENAGKEISVKAYGNEVAMISRNMEIARYERSYEKGKTFYRLEHYMELIERRPRSVYNAKPVKSNVPKDLLEFGKRFSDHRDMVKLLRLFVDYGEEKLLSAIGRIKSPVVSIEQVLSYLTSVEAPESTNLSSDVVDVEVLKPKIDNYDQLIERGANV